MSLEAWINNNVKFYSYPEVYTFISRIACEPTQFNTFEVIDKKNVKSHDELYTYLSGMFDFKATTEEETSIKNFISNLSDEQIARIYYKRNILEFMFDNEYVTNCLASCFSTEFLDPNKATKFKRNEAGEIQYSSKGDILLEKDEELDANINNLYSLLDEFVTYKYLYEDRPRVVATMDRKTVMTCDTDSVFVRLSDFYYKFLENFEIPEGTEEKIQKICIANIMTLMVSKYLRTMMDIFTSNYNIKQEKEQKKIVFKSEYLFDRVVLTSNKKHYAGAIIMQEGVIYKETEVDMKGLKIRKSDTPKITREYFTEMLKNDIILKKDIDAIQIFKKYRAFEQRIRKETLEDRVTLFSTPAKFNSINSYAAPYTQQSVRAVVLWNKLNPNNPINNFEKINLFPLVIPNADYLQLIKDDDIRKVFHDVLFNEESELFGKEPVIALPKTLKIFPEYLVELIDINAIIKLNVGSIKPIMATLGFNCVDKIKGGSAVTNFIKI